MHRQSGALHIGLDVLKDIDKPVKRRRKSLAHIYKKKDGIIRFKAIVHEDVEGIVASRQSFKAVVTIVPEDNIPKYPNKHLYISWALSTIILIYLNTCYVKDPGIALLTIGMNLLCAGYNYIARKRV